MAFLRFSDAARQRVQPLAGSMGQARAKRILERAFHIALDRGADGNPLHRTGDRIELADVEQALAEEVAKN